MPSNSTFEPLWQRARVQVLRADGATGHVAQRAAVGIHHAKTGGAQPGVDADYAHCNLPCLRWPHASVLLRTKGRRSPCGPA